MLDSFITRDGLTLPFWRTRVTGARNTVIFINALGIEHRLTLELGEAINHRGADFITWDRRGFPGASEENFRQYGPQNGINDLCDLIEQLALQDIVLAAWCTGAQIALGAIATRAVAPRRLILFNNPNYFDDGFSGVQGDAIGKICQSIVSNERKLEFFYEVIGKTIMPVNASSEEGPEGLSRLQQQLIQAPFTSGQQNLLRYAHLICNSSDLMQTRRWCAEIMLPTLLVAGAQDHMVASDDAVRLASILPTARVDIMPDWGHYSLFKRTSQTAAKIIT
ncbi:alpha/beta hydrolase [Xenorhabdus bovienii]|uniref:alpha/beta hydrolase n=1 Tax=Xenorhabdus bovienii TaxID=40576 RepID=UPI0023B2C69E|nr:alpha/beta hydrolase [Xenorhabdus bovienii]MDE9482431.1 alpha/beta hydrolase [Xenorhabdus bovienii]MDE9556307.1 alpha/beta hydrolase [Xenorhabdus bovienii]